MLVPEGTGDQWGGLYRALEADTRRMWGVIEFDWWRDGRYDHPYSDLSRIRASTNTDRSNATSLPEEVNTIVGSSSGELTATLEGRRRADEPTAAELFDPYNYASPLYGIEILGTPMRYSRVTATDQGDVSLPVFTGFVRDAPFSREKQSVDITAADHVSFASVPVTLLHWAQQGFVPGSGYYRNISTTWVMEEILRQAGRPVGPVPRDDAVMYLTCSGAMLPSVGNMANAYQVPDNNHEVSMIPDPWRPSPFGLCPNTNIPATGEKGVARSMMSTSRQVVVPQDNTNQPALTLGFAGWAYLDPADTAGDRDTWHRFYIEDARYGERWWLTGTNGYESADSDYPGRCHIALAPRGQLTVWCTESQVMSGRRWWSFSANACTGGAGWYYISVLYRFTPTSVDADLYVNDKRVTLSKTRPSGGFRYRGDVTEDPWNFHKNGGPLRLGRTNIVDTWISGAPMCHCQWFYGRTDSTDYIPGQGDQPLLPNGKPHAVIRRSIGELCWLPNVEQRGAWSLLKDVCVGEYGVLTIDEYGTVRFAPRTDMQQISDNQILAALDLTDDRLAELLISPTVDSKRNIIRATINPRIQIPDLIWKQEHALERPVVASNGTVTERVPLGEDVISVSTKVDPVPASDPKPQDQVNVLVGQCSAVRIVYEDEQYPSQPGQLGKVVSVPKYRLAANGWAANVSVGADPRWMTLLWASPFTFTQWIGSYEEGNQASWYVAGRRYSDEQKATHEYRVKSTRDAILTIGDTDWLQTEATAKAIAESLLVDTVQPAPLLDRVTVPADPRRQLFDVLRVTNETGSSGLILGQIVEKSTRDGRADFMDELTLKVISTPNIALWDVDGVGWDVGVWAE